LHKFFSALICALAVSSLALQGCSTIKGMIGLGEDTHLDLNAEVFYKFSGKVCYDGTCFNGAGVLPHSDEIYDIKFHAERADFVKIKGCNRTRQLTNEGTSFVFRMKHNEVEDRISCKIRANAFDFKKQLHSFYFVAFEKHDFKLPFTTICDGYSLKRNGVGVCQIGKGQVGKIKFDMKVKLFKGDRCNIDFEYAPGKPIAIGTDFEFRNREHGEHVCEWVEMEEPYRRGFSYILVYQQEIFPKESK